MWTSIGGTLWWKSLKLTAILDQDEAVFAPKFVACEPRWWLWEDD